MIYLGKAEVVSVFRSTKFGNIAGVQITDGVARADGWVRIVRDGVPVVGPHRVRSLRQYKNDREEVGVGQECGIGLDDRVQVGDVLVFGANLPFDLSEFEGKRFSMVFANDGQRVHTGRIVNGALAYDDKRAAATAMVEVRVIGATSAMGKAVIGAILDYENNGDKND